MKGAGEFVLYLDFDGVLHHENCLWSPKIGPYVSAGEGYTLFQHVGLLEQALEPHPQVLIVLSTSWVLRYGCSTTAKRLPPALRQRVVGASYHSRIARAEYFDAMQAAGVAEALIDRQGI